MFCVLLVFVSFQSQCDVTLIMATTLQVLSSIDNISLLGDTLCCGISSHLPSPGYGHTPAIVHTFLSSPASHSSVIVSAGLI